MSDGGDGARSAILKLRGPTDLLPLLPSFADLAAGTEFASYKDPQWRFLLRGKDITGCTVPSCGGGGESTIQPRLDGCVLRVELGHGTVGFGMVLVRPSQRGRGLARSMMETAMRSDDDGRDCERYVLAVCSSLGQPLYRSLGFKEAGSVTLMTCVVSTLLRMRPQRRDREHMTVISGKDCTRDQITSLARRDERATGIRRRERIELLLKGYADGSCATVAHSSASGSIDDATSIAVARQDCTDGPLVVGPVMGNEEGCTSLLRALAEEHFEERARNDANDIPVAMMVSDHPCLVTLLEANGMSKAWECPAMSSDGAPVYRNGDGSYLAMMHPTLG